ncbi:phenylacetate--CoA ligase family protein [Calditrichota bacterium]
MILNAIAMYTVMRNRKKTSESLSRLVSKRLQQLLISAYDNVPYYRSTMDRVGYSPRKDFTGPDDLTHLPILTRQILKNREPKEFLNRTMDMSNLYWSQSSGSSGKPIQVWREPWSRAIKVACWLRVLYENGYDPRDRVLALADPSRLAGETMLLQKFGFYRRWVEDILTPTNLIVDRILKIRPNIIYGTRSCFTDIFNELNSRNVRIDWMKMSLIGGEIINDKVKIDCQSHFGIPLTEFYGTVETGILAHETSDRDGLHLNEDLVYYEFLDDNDKPVEPGQSGHLVVTRLTGNAMPLIRYKVGDYVTYKVVRNVNGGFERRIVSVDGRDNDIVVLSNGKRLQYYQFTLKLYKYHNLTEFRIIQDSKDHLKILLVGEDAYLDEIEGSIMSDFNKLLDGASTYSIIRVDEIPRDASGKTRAVIAYN